MPIAAENELVQDSVKKLQQATRKPATWFYDGVKSMTVDDALTWLAWMAAEHDEVPVLESLMSNAKWDTGDYRLKDCFFYKLVERSSGVHQYAVYDRKRNAMIQYLKTHAPAELRGRVHEEAEDRTQQLCEARKGDQHWKNRHHQLNRMRTSDRARTCSHSI